MAVNDFGSDYSAFNKHYNTSVPRSVFDKSQLHSFTTDFGVLRPFYVEYTVPGDDYDISVETLIKALALVHPPLTRVRYFIHFYFQQHLNDLWHQFDNFVTLGNTGKMDLEPPRVFLFHPYRYLDLFSDTPVSSVNWYVSQLVSKSFTDASYFYVPLSDWYSGSFVNNIQLLGMFGLPPLWSYASGTTESTTFGDAFSLGNVDLKNMFIDAFPFAMYQNTFRCFYNDRDMAISADFANTQVGSWQPLDYHDFGLHSGLNATMRDDLFVGSGSVQSLADYDGSQPLSAYYSSASAVDTALLSARIRNYRGDYFTTAKLWPQRGNPPTLDLNPASGSSAPVTITLDNGQFVNINFPASINPVTTSAVSARASAVTSGSSVTLFLPNAIPGTAGPGGPLTSSLNGVTGSGTADLSNVTLSSPITVQNLAALEIINLWQQRNAFTDGSYNEIIKAQFGVYPGLDEYAPVYIGGTSGDISFTEVLQSVDSADVPLGEQGGHGISVGSGRIGHVHSNDYGMIMGIISIMPDTMYHQGIPREMTKQSYTDYYYPLFNGLGPQGILQKELYFTGNPAQDDKLFGYQGRYDEMRYKPNIVSGKLADVDDEYWKAWTIMRHFDSAPNLNANFLSSYDISHAAFAYDKEPPFIVQIATRARAVRPLPSQAPMVTI